MRGAALSAGERGHPAEAEVGADGLHRQKSAQRDDDFHQRARIEHLAEKRHGISPFPGHSYRAWWRLRQLRRWFGIACRSGDLTSTQGIVVHHHWLRGVPRSDSGCIRPSRQRPSARVPVLPHNFRTALPPSQPSKPPSVRDAFSPRRPSSPFSHLLHNGEPGRRFRSPVRGG